MTQFAFIEREWPDVFDAASRAEAAARADPRTSCFYTRRALELTVAWMYKHDSAVTLPYQENLSALMNPALLYSSPYTDFSPLGVDGLFESAEAAEIVSILRSVSRTAAA